MPREIIRIGIQWYPPDDFKKILERTWNGQLNTYKACDLVAKHCGECPIWGAHVTLLDAMTIIEDDWPQFIKAMNTVLKDFLPISLTNPEIKDWGWGNNVFLRWKEDCEREKLKLLREELMKRAREFMIVEQVNWEAVNELDRTVKAMNNLVTPNFQKGLKKLKRLLVMQPLKLAYAPNIPLDWYVSKIITTEELKSGELPFPFSPHMSIATAVTDDKSYNMSAKEVGDYIKAELKNVPDWNQVLANNETHYINYANIVQPEPQSYEPIELTIIDRISSRRRMELRQKWVPTERLPMS